MDKVGKNWVERWMDFYLGGMGVGGEKNFSVWKVVQQQEVFFVWVGLSVFLVWSYKKRKYAREGES